jgi:hypothetical protein
MAKACTYSKKRKIPIKRAEINAQEGSLKEVHKRIPGEF